MYREIIAVETVALYEELLFLLKDLKAKKEAAVTLLYYVGREI